MNYDYISQPQDVTLHIRPDSYNNKTSTSCHLLFCSGAHLRMLSSMHSWLRHYWYSLTISSVQFWKSHRFSPFPSSIVEAWGQFSHATTVQHMKGKSKHLPSTGCWQKLPREHRGLQSTERVRFWYFIYESDVLMHPMLSNASAHCFKKRKPSPKYGSPHQACLSEKSSEQAEWGYITQDQAVRKPEQAVWPSQRRDVTSVLMRKSQTSP